MSKIFFSSISENFYFKSWHLAGNRLDYERRRGMTTVDHSDIRGLVTAGQVSVGGCLGLLAGVQFGEELCHKGVSRIPQTAFFVSLVIGAVRSFLKAQLRGCGRHPAAIRLKFREKQSQALRGRNLTRNIPVSDAPTVHQTSGGLCCQGSFSFSCWTSEPCLKNPGGEAAFP